VFYFQNIEWVSVLLLKRRKSTDRSAIALNHKICQNGAEE
jgi:hypothetical protein